MRILKYLIILINENNNTVPTTLIENIPEQYLENLCKCILPRMPGM